MRILLIAYEFPPVIAAQSLRWFYLANALARLGVEVHVLCPDMPALTPFPEAVADGVTVHRVWAGPYVGFSQSAYLYLSKKPSDAGRPRQAGRQSLLLKLHRWGRRVLDQIIFPDLRSEWLPFAALQMRTLLRQTQFSAVVASHEPGVDLLLGLLAKKFSGVPLIVDLADPVLAPYTPRWRRRLDRAFEKKVLAQADVTVVTTPALIQLLKERHGLQNVEGKFACVSQGFPDDVGRFNRNDRLPSKLLRLVYTGNFYSDFRSPAELSTALRALGDLGISVNFFGNHVAFESLFDGIASVQFFGVVDHRTCLEAQNDCDLLLSIGNSQAFQIPGKIYEYLGVGKPILHLSNGSSDEAGSLIAQLGAGWAVQNNATSIEHALRAFHALWMDGTLWRVFARDETAIAEFAWSKRASRYKDVIEQGASCQKRAVKLPAY